MKKIFTIIAMLALCIGTIISLSSCEKKGLQYELSDDKSYYKVIGYNGESTDISIPEKYKGKPVKEIAVYAFLNLYNLFSSLDNWVSPNGMHVHMGDVLLSSDSIILSENSMSSVSITSIAIPSSVTVISPTAFDLCIDLVDITVSNDNSVYKSIDGDLYTKDGKTLLIATVADAEFYTIQSGVEKIGESAFVDDNKLKNITIPATVTEINESALGNMEMLTSISVDENNSAYKLIDGNLYTKDGKTLIRYISAGSDQSFELPNTVNTIAPFAFSYAASLKRIHIPSSVTNIGSKAFIGCKALTSIIIPKTVTAMGEAVFYGCAELKVYAEAEAKPDGWDSQWENIGYFYTTVKEETEVSPDSSDLISPDSSDLNSATGVWTGVFDIAASEPIAAIEPTLKTVTVEWGYNPSDAE